MRDKPPFRERTNIGKLVPADSLVRAFEEISDAKNKLEELYGFNTVPAPPTDWGDPHAPWNKKEEKDSA